MQIVRTIVWVLLLVAFLLFSFANWDERVVVQIWENLVWETKLPAVVVVAFLVGLVPMWLLHLATRWQYRRRIGSLEHAARASVVPPAAPPAAAPVPEPNSEPVATPPPAEPVQETASQPVAQPIAEPLPEEPRTDGPFGDETKPPQP
jgi:lipopolysaccharide assembly protein A